MGQQPCPARPVARHAARTLRMGWNPHQYSSADINKVSEAMSRGDVSLRGRAAPAAQTSNSMSGGMVARPGVSSHRLIQFANPLEPHERANRILDACYAPRGIHETGDLDIHDVGVMRDGRLSFSARATAVWRLSIPHSPRWHEPSTPDLRKRISG